MFGDVRDLMVKLPCHSPVYGAPAWLTDPEHYPSYVKVYRALRPRSLIEVGAFVGYSLAAAVYACPELTRVLWVDDESGQPGSNRMAERNMLAAMEGPESYRALTYRHYRDTGEIRGELPVDVIHIDGDHTFEAVRRDLNWAVGMGPKFIIGHDLDLPGAGVRRAVEHVFGPQNRDWVGVLNLTQGLFVIPLGASVADTTRALEQEGLLVP